MLCCAIFQLLAPNKIKNPLKEKIFMLTMLKSQNWCECQKMWLLHLFQACFNFWSFFQAKCVCYHCISWDHKTYYFSLTWQKSDFYHFLKYQYSVQHLIIYGVNAHQKICIFTSLILFIFVNFLSFFYLYLLQKS